MRGGHDRRRGRRATAIVTVGNASGVAVILHTSRPVGSRIASAPVTSTPTVVSPANSRSPSSSYGTTGGGDSP